MQEACSYIGRRNRNAAAKLEHNKEGQLGG
jgi:hypothetical protein